MARARVQMIVEIDVPDGWGPDCPVSQVRSQAANSAIGALRRGLVIDGLVSGPGNKTIARIVGQPKVTVIIVDDSVGATSSEGGDV